MDPGPPNIGATQMVQPASRVSKWGGGLHSDQREAESNAKVANGRLTVASKVTEVGFFQITTEFVRKSNCRLLSAPSVLLQTFSP